MDVMEAMSDEDFDHVPDFDVCDVDSEEEEEGSLNHSTPSTTPPRHRTPKPSRAKTIACPYKDCGKTFSRNVRLQEHIRSHTGERPFKCAFCTKDFLRDSHLKHHLTSAHSDERKYGCTWPTCGKRFATGTRLRRHVQAHEGREKYRCRGYNGCDKTFRKHETLKKHVLIVHEHKRPFPCERLNMKDDQSCTQSFDTLDKLKSHHRSVHDKTRFVCTACSLQKVRTTVTNDESLNDDTQSYSFPTFADLQLHILEVHPPTCEYCPLSFTTNRELKRHQEVQHGIIDITKATAAQFPCTYAECKHVFTKKGNLNVHIKTVHEQKKDFVCGITELPVPEELVGTDIEVYGCGRDFTSKASLIEHVRVSHFNLPSKRMVRNERKRRLRHNTNDANGPDGEGLGLKRRATRKDAGLKKTSALSALAGAPFKVQTQHSTEPSYFPLLPYGSASTPNLETGQGKCQDGQDEPDGFNQLSGSMTLLGSHLYYNGHGYHLHNERDSAASTPREAGAYMPCEDATGSNEFDAMFEFEQESEIFHNMVDPVLLQP